MQKNYFLRSFLVFLMSISASFGQTNKDGSVTVNGKTLKGKISIDHDIKTVTRKADGAEWTFNFGEVSSVVLEDKNYVVQESLTSGYVLLTPLVTGSANLYQDPTKDIFINTESKGLRKLNLQNNSIRGELLLYFSDCLPVRDRINELSRINLSTVIELTKVYNNCGNYSEDFVFSDEELKRMERGKKDIYNFYLGAGYYSKSLQIDLGGGTNTVGGVLLNAGLKLSPGFLGALQDNVFFTASLDYLVKTKIPFNTFVTGRVTVATQSVKLLGGIYYTFNKENTWQPYIGVKGGLTSTIYDFNLSASPDGEVPELNESVDKHIFNPEPEIGVFYQLNDQSALNLGFSYFPKTKVQFSSAKLISLPITIEETGFNISLRYHFL